MYKVTEKDLIGDLKGFPIEVVQKMLEEQVKQGNKEDVKVFQAFSGEDCSLGGFDWVKTIEGQDFWYDVLTDKNFNEFFKKYPKKRK